MDSTEAVGVVSNDLPSVIDSGSHSIVRLRKIDRGERPVLIQESRAECRSKRLVLANDLSLVVDSLCERILRVQRVREAC